MSDEDLEAQDEIEDEDVGAEEAPKKRFSAKKLVLFVVLPLLLLGGGGAGLLFSGLLGGEEEPAEVVEAESQEDLDEEGRDPPDEPRDIVFYDLPEMLVNLNSPGRQTSFLKIQVSLELGSAEAVPEVEAVLPRIVDNFQVYLRELRPEELTGTKGVYRLKEELLVRVNTAVEPVRVYDVLFKEILVQS